MDIEKNSTNKRRKRPAESELAALYQEHTSSEIAEKYGVTTSTVNNWLQYYRKHTTTNEIKNISKQGGRPLKRPSEAELAELYKKYTASEIAKMYGVSLWTAGNWIQFYRRNPENDDLKKVSKSGGRPLKRPPESELAALYAEHSATEIAKMYKVSIWTVRNWIQYYRANPQNADGENVMPDKER